MARETGIYRRQDSRFWWIDAVLPNGERVRQSARTENRQAAEAYLAQLKLAAYREAYFGIKPQRAWQEAVVRYLSIKANLRSIEDVRRICRKLDPVNADSKLTHFCNERRFKTDTPPLHLKAA